MTIIQKKFFGVAHFHEQVGFFFTWHHASGVWKINSSVKTKTIIKLTYDLINECKL